MFFTQRWKLKKCNKFDLFQYQSQTQKTSSLYFIATANNLIYFCVWRRIMFVGSLSFFFSRLSIEVNFNLIEVQSVFREVIDFLQVSRSLLRRNGIYLQNIWTFASNSNFTVWKINNFSAAIQILREINFNSN